MNTLINNRFDDISQTIDALIQAKNKIIFTPGIQDHLKIKMPKSMQSAFHERPFNYTCREHPPIANAIPKTEEININNA